MDATVAERGQVVIPKAMRDQLGIKPGMQLSFSVEGSKLVIRKKVDDAISRARGIFKLAPGETVESIMRELRGRAPDDPIEPWEELRDDMYIPAAIREDHAKRRAEWLAGRALASKKESPEITTTALAVVKRSTRKASASSAVTANTAAKSLAGSVPSQPGKVHKPTVGRSGSKSRRTVA